MTSSFVRRACSLLVAGLLSSAGGAVSAQTMLEQIHGLAFTPDGKGIMVPAHTGLIEYRARRWKDLLPTPLQFTSVSVTHDAAYASGPRASLMAPQQPGGLLKSTDGGRSWRHLSEAGQADFAFMAAGFRSNAIFVISTASDPRMPVPGLYHTQDEGKTWSAAAQRLPAGITSIAVHPEDKRTVAVGAPDGLHVSRDSGATFRLLPAGKAITAVLFDAGGEHIYVARKGVSAVDRVSLAGERTRSLALPIASRDFVTYIAQNPGRAREIAVATHLRNIFVSSNGGGTWRTIARQGRPA